MKAPTPTAPSGAFLLAACRPATTLVLALPLVLAACANPQGIAPRLGLQALQAQPASPSVTNTPWPEGQAWRRWGDAELDRLVARALARQPSLQTVQARLQQAAAGVELAGAASGPQLSGTLDMTRQRFTENGLVPPALGGATRWNNTSQLNGSWELDLFGRHRAELAAAVGQTRVAEAEARAAEVLLVANVASAYVGLARAVAQRDLAEATLKQREQVLSLVRQRIEAGLDTTVELRQSEGTIAQSRVEREAAEEQIARGRHALAELCGDPPDSLAQLSPRLANLPSRPLPAGLPADLLGRRADLVAQRWRVEAASAETDLARAQFYPNINLVAFVGLSSIALDNFLQAGSRTYGVGPAVRLPIFDGGRLRANLKSRAAEVDAAVAGYNGALLRALREVADEVASLRAIERQQAAQAEALAAAESAFNLASQRYQAGLGNFLVVLTAEANVLAQRRASTELTARHLQSEVALGRALGGGYHADALPALAVGATPAPS